MCRRKLSRPKQALARHRDYETLRKYFAKRGNTHAEYLKRAIDYEEKWREGILRIFEVSLGNELLQLDTQSLLERLGISGWIPASIDPNDDATGYKEAASPGSGKLGAGTIFCTNEHNITKAVVILKTTVIPRASNDFCRAVDIAHLYHELGHVDDFERGVNIVMGAEDNIEASEYYAHEFACAQMRRFNLKMPLGFYVGFSLEDMVRCGVPAYASSARKFLDSNEGKVSKEFAAEHLLDYEKLKPN